MSLVYNTRYNEYVKSNEHDITMNGCFVCFDDVGKKYGICRHCLLGVCNHSECVDVFPHIDDTEYLICADCKHVIEKKLKPITYTEKDHYEEKIEKQYAQKLLQQAEAEKLGYENTLTYIKMLHIVK